MIIGAPPIIGVGKPTQDNTIEDPKISDNGKNIQTTIEGDLQTTTNASTATYRDTREKTSISNDPRKKMSDNWCPSRPPQQNTLSKSALH